MRCPRKSKRALLAAGLIAASLSIAACGSSGPTTTLNAGKIERAIENSSWVQRGQRAEASCPSDVPQTEGLKFSCTAVVGQTKTRFVVVEQDGAGHVHYEAP